MTEKEKIIKLIENKISFCEDCKLNEAEEILEELLEEIKNEKM